MCTVFPILLKRKLKCSINEMFVLSDIINQLGELRPRLKPWPGGKSLEPFPPGRLHAVLLLFNGQEANGLDLSQQPWPRTAVDRSQPLPSCRALSST